MDFKENLGKKILFFDGAMGSVLQAKGLAIGQFPEIWNKTHEDIIVSIHEEYINNGANIIKTNTFGANRLKMTAYGVEDIISSAVTLAKKAAKGRALVALDIGPTGKLLKPFGDLDFEAAYEIFSEMVVSGTRAGADLILIETMTDVYEAKAAILAAKEHSTLPVVVTFSFDENGKLLTGGDVQLAVSVAEGLGVDAIGCNCGMGPATMTKLVAMFAKYASIPIVASPNAGLPCVRDGKTMYDVSPVEFADDMALLLKAGAAVIGGCCGTTAAHIGSMTEKCKDISVLETSFKTLSMVSSYSKCVILGEKPMIIGERINPTGKPRLKQALYEGDMDYLCNEGMLQIEKGAEILDVNVGLADIDEAETMKKAVIELQSVLSTPLQIDTSNTKALEAALRIYNGKPIVNSVNGKQSSLHSVLPLVKKYGAMVVGLTLDESGIPETTEGRIAIAKKIMDTAQEYGIDKKDILIDALTLTVSTGQDNAKITLDAVDYIRNQLKVNTVLGVSNISFGLPARDILNSAFLTLAFEKGLSAAIINPLSEPMMDAYFSYAVLSGNDSACMRYIQNYTKQVGTSSQGAEKNATLSEAIVKGLREQAKTVTLQLLTDTKPLDIIDGHIIPALNQVGQGFEEKTLFLPNLLMSAEAAKASFEEIKKHLLSQGITQEKKGKVILATVEGDIHDIGKNIVKVLLENYNFHVIDLGKDVPTELIVETAIKENVSLVGLSALMTTTVCNMEKTIVALKNHNPSCKVMVGGAVLTQAYADKIGADSYASDAMGSVHFANSLYP